MTKFFIIFGFAISLFFQSAHAADINLTTKLNSELAKLRDYKLAKNCKASCDLPGVSSGPGHCTPRNQIDPENLGKHRTQVQNDMFSLLMLHRGNKAACCGWSSSCTVSKGKLKLVGGADFTNAKFDFHDPVYNELPSNAEVAKVRWVNCTSATQSLNRTITLSSTSRDTITTTDTVSKSTTSSVSVGFKFEVFGIGGNAGGSYSVNRRHSLANQTSQSESKTISRTTTISLKIPPNSVLTAEAAIFDLPASVPFTLSAVASGDVQKNLEGIKSASEVLTPESRRFVTEGMIEATMVSEIEVATYESKAECAESKQLTLSEARFSLPLSQESMDDVKNSYLEFAADNDGFEEELCRVLGTCEESSCSATNGNNSATCEISCPVGQAATCMDATADNQPSCLCN